MVPLAEEWDSGASASTAARRKAYANDLGDARSLVAVTGNSTRPRQTRIQPSGVVRGEGQVEAG